MQFNGKSLDANDIRHDEPGYRPLPKLRDCSEGEKEYLMQSLEGQLHRGSRLVAQYEPFLADQEQDDDAELARGNHCSMSALKFS